MATKGQKQVIRTEKEKINLYKKESFKFSPTLTKPNNYYMSTVTTTNNSSSRANTAASRRPEKIKEKEIKSLKEEFEKEFKDEI